MPTEKQAESTAVDVSEVSRAESTVACSNPNFEISEPTCCLEDEDAASAAAAPQGSEDSEVLPGQQPATESEAPKS